MARTIRFHLDEHIPAGVAAGLRQRGINVTTTADADLLHAEDAEHRAYALRTQRVLVTHDEDHLMLAARGIKHSGIAFCPRNRAPSVRLFIISNSFGNCSTRLKCTITLRGFEGIQREGHESTKLFGGRATWRQALLRRTTTQTAP
jgi:hypothetical protein